MLSVTSVTFTSSGSWAAAAATADCQAWAEGGNGGTSTHGSRSGGGGGGGEYAEETALAVSGTISFTIGSGGTSTNTSFPGTSVTVTANFGTNAPGQSPGSAGTGSSNSVHHDGGNGGTGLANSNTGGAGGGGSAGATGAGGLGSGGTSGGAAGGSAGSGGGAAGGAGGANSATGSNGNAPGSGGGGGGSGGSLNHTGGTGAAGQITLTYSSAVSGTATLSGVGTLTAAGNIAGTATLAAVGTLTATRSGFGTATLTGTGTLTALATQRAIATLAGVGTLTATGGTPAPAVVNQWANSYGQGTTFASITSALQSCVTGLTPAFSVGAGSGTPTAGNWLFCIASWTQNPSIANVHVGVGDDIHSWWRQYPASGSAGNVRTSISYTPNIARAAGNVYVAPDGEIAAINVLVVEISGLGPWDTAVGTNTNYTAAGTSLALSLSAPPRASFFIGATGGDNTASGQAFLPSGYTALATQTQDNGSDHLADNILTAAFRPSSTLAQSVSGTASSSEGMSGFLLGVEVAADSPVPAGHNPNWPYLIFEAAFGSGFNTPVSEMTWTDLTSRLWSWDETSGIQYQLGELQAALLEFQADNNDRALTSTNTSSPYYPNVEPGTPVRLRMALGTTGGTVVNRWYILQRFAQEWDEQIDEQFRYYVNGTGTDLWNALSVTPPTFYRSEIYEDGPYAWWPLDDQPGPSGVLPVTMLNAAIGNTKTMNIALSPLGGGAQTVYSTSGQPSNGIDPTHPGPNPSIASYTVGASSGWMFGDPQESPPSIATGNAETPSPGSAAWQQAGAAGTAGSSGWYLSCNDTGFPALSGGVTIEAWFNYPFFGTSAEGWFSGSSVGIATQQPYGPLTIWEIATDTHPVAVLQLSVTGDLSLITYAAGTSTGTSHVIYSAADLRTGNWHMATVTLTTTGWTVWLDGGALATVSGSATAMTSAWTWLILNADFGTSGGTSPASIQHGGNVSLAHIAVYPLTLPYYRVMDHYWAAVSAFGQIPAPSGVTSQMTGAGAASQTGPLTAAPDGSIDSGTYDGSSFTGNGTQPISAIVTANVAGYTSGPSARGVTVGSAYGIFGWVGWTGLAAEFTVYDSASAGSEQQASVSIGAGDSYSSGFGAAAAGHGACHLSGGSGASPPATGSATGDTVGQRIERMLSGGKFASPSRCIDQAPLLVQAPGTTGGGTQAGSAIQAIQQSDDGMLFIDNCGNLTYWERPHLASQYSSPVWSIGPSAGSIPYYQQIRWITDPQRVYNAITISPLSPTGAALPLITPADATTANASQVRYGAQPLQVTSWLQSTPEMQAQADWLLSTFGTPHRRAEQVLIDAASYPAAWPLVLGVNVGDVVTLEDWLIGGGGAVYTMRVTEVKRHLSYGTHNEPVTGQVILTLDIEPASYWS